MTHTVVAISATYGAGGTRIGPLIAHELDLPFLSRLVIPEVAGPEEIEPAEQPESLFRRVIEAFAKMPAVIGATMPMPSETLSDEQRIRVMAEEETCRAARTTGAVVLGRGAVAFLRGDPSVYRVRLDGPVERRIRQGMALEGVDDATARRRQRATDRARALYVQRAYGVDLADPSLYHLTIDTTAVALDVAASAIAELVRAAAAS